MEHNDPLIRLAEFQKNNPSVKLAIQDDAVTVSEPWGDDTLEFRFAADDDRVFDALNQLLLPPVFSAIFHRDCQALEFIYAPMRVEVSGRAFDFTFTGRTYRCEFAPCSPRLFTLADIVHLIKPPSHTEHRNFGIFDARKQEDLEASQRGGTSFWVRGGAWHEDTVLDLCRSLNFYMWYFDRQTPRIRVHERNRIEGSDRTPRYLFETFPKQISGRPVDAFVMQLWRSFVKGSNPIHRFLYGYQIIEYVSFYYVQEWISQTITRALCSPDVVERSRAIARQIVEAVTEDRMEDAAKIERVIDLYVDANELATAIGRDAKYFSTEQQFDGGFSLSALCGPNCVKCDKKEAKDLLRRVATSLRKIRNALVHSRESRNVNSIAPTLANEDRILPWLAPLSVIVSHLILYAEGDPSAQ